MQKNLVKGVLLALPVLVLSGCYTVFNAPRVSSRPTEQDAWESSNPRLKAEQYTAEEDFYRYPGDIYGYGGDPYPYGGGSPYIGYSSSSGFYGYGSYGYPGHAYGYGNAYGPYGYGADPYYVDNGGYYLPPGYELITTRELEDYRDTIHTLTTRQPDPEADARAEEFRRQREEERQQVFQSRLNPSRSRADFQPYVPPAEPPSESAPSSTVRKSSGGSSKSSSSSNSGTDIKSKSKRRRGR